MLDIGSFGQDYRKKIMQNFLGDSWLDAIRARFLIHLRNQQSYGASICLPINPYMEFCCYFF